MNETITKKDLINYLHNSMGLNKSEAKDVLECFFKEIIICLSGKGNVKISGFGNFEIIQKKERSGRNPKTGEPAKISARTVVTFRAGQKLRNLISTYNG